MLNKVKLLLGLTSTDKDDLLTLLIETAIEEAVNYTQNDDTQSLERCICQMVVYQYNRLGTEGVDGESFSGVSYDYSTDYPESILRQLRAHRKLGVY